MSRGTRTLLAATILSLGLSMPAWAQQADPVDDAVPPLPATTQPDAAAPIDTPITGAAINPVITDVVRPPSLEEVMAVRPGYSPSQHRSDARDQALRQAAWTYGARAGLAARSFAINDMLQRYSPVLDRTFDFRTVLLPMGGSTLLRPPVVTEAQMAVALDPSGENARETGKIYQITRRAAIVSAPPQWRTWLWRDVVLAELPAEQLMPTTRDEVEIWRDGVAKGWAAGNRQAVEIFLDDLARLQRDIVGMARYRVLLKAGMVEPPAASTLVHPVTGGQDTMWIDDTVTRLRKQPGLDADRAHWTGADGNP